MSDREMSDREMSDREMSDREMSDRKFRSSKIITTEERHTETNSSCPWLRGVCLTEVKKGCL